MTDHDQNGEPSPELNLAALMKGTRMVGPGLRDAIWVQGCSLRCPGCANQAYLPHVPRARISVARLLLHLRARRNQIHGISVAGGEPTEQPQAVAALLRGARAMGLSTVVYSGHTYEHLLRDPACSELFKHTDLLIDGPFIAAQYDAELYWRGSRNQRFLRLSDRFTAADLEPPKANGEIVLSETGVLLHGVGTGGGRFRLDRLAPALARSRGLSMATCLEKARPLR
jgi:anaerobic ribonucleoside-triphosphate reductase activating protein